MIETLSETEFALQPGKDSFIPKYFVEISDLMRKKIETVYPYEEEVPKLSGIREIPLDPPFSKGEIRYSLSESNQKGSPPFEKGRTGGISGKAFSNG